MSVTGIVNDTAFHALIVSFTHSQNHNLYKYLITYISKMILNEQKIAIIEEFLRDYSLKITGSEIARKKNLNQKSAANTLLELEEHGFLKSEIEGKNKHYFLQIEDKELILHFILAVEHVRTINFYKKNLLIKEIMYKIKPLCKGMLIVFGSYAKGLQKKDSDVDIFLAGECNAKEIQKIQDAYGIALNIKQYSLNKLSLDDHLVKEVITDHIFINNCDEFVSLLLR